MQAVIFFLRQRAPLTVIALLGAASIALPDASAVPCAPGEVCKDAVLTATDAELAWRYIGRMPLEFASAACPSSPGWTATKVFTGSNDTVPAALTRYCIYTANTPQDPSPPVPAVNGLEQLDRDVMAASPMGGSALKQTVGAALHAQFLSQASRAGVAPTGATNIRLAVLDTMPGSNTPMNDPVPIAEHGYALLHMAEDLACNELESGCAIGLSSSLALPWRCALGPPCRDLDDGGFMGTPTDIAQAVWRELLKWEQGGEAGLVINLSLGWDPVFNDRSDGMQRVATETTIKAIQTARCRGAIVVAATGNNLAGPERPDGPLMPAAFNQVAAPKRTECQAMFPGESFPAANFPPGDGSQPLLHAVGAVGADDQPFLARFDGEPELVAYADHGIAIDRNGAYTATLSGSSTAALVASATLAQVWSYSPGQAGWQIMQSVYDAGLSVPNAAGNGLRIADYCLDSAAPCGEVHKVTLCEAVQASCSGAGCPTAQELDCNTPQWREALLDRDAVETLFTGATSIDVDAPGLDSAVIAECEPRPGSDYTLIYPSGAVPDNPCPHLQFYGTQATPYAGGQPGQTNCEDCPINYASPGKLYLQVDAPFDSRDAVLFCIVPDGSMLAYSLHALGVLSTPQRYVIENIAESCAGNGLFLAAIPTGLGANDAATVITPLIVSTDPDQDGVPAAIDNCLATANPQQRDTDGDGIGNRCDPDLSNDCVINTQDLGLLRQVFFSNDEDADFNGDGFVNPLDLAIMREFFFSAPGPGADDTLCVP